MQTLFLKIRSNWDRNSEKQRLIFYNLESILTCFNNRFQTFSNNISKQSIFVEFTYKVKPFRPNKNDSYLLDIVNYTCSTIHVILRVLFDNVLHISVYFI